MRGKDRVGLILPSIPAGLFPFSTALGLYQPRSVSQKSCVLPQLLSDEDMCVPAGDGRINAYVADMGLFIQSVASVASQASTFGDLLRNVVETVCRRARKAHCGVVYCNCDSYRKNDPGGAGGLKCNTWERRGGGLGTNSYGQFLLTAALPRGRKDGIAAFLREASNKERLLDLLRLNLTSLLPTGDDAPLAVFAVVDRCEYECTRVAPSPEWRMAPCPALDSVFCEADQGMVTSCVHHFDLRARQGRSGEARVVVASEDTDVTVALIALHDEIREKAAGNAVICVQRGKERDVFNMGCAVARLNAQHGEHFTKVRGG